MRDYEIVYIFRSSFTAEEIEAKLERYHALITEGDRGEITAVVQWGKRQLAYPIQKQSGGHYVVAQFRAEPEVLTGLERVLKLEDDLLRYLVVLSEGELPLPVAMSSDEAPAPGSGDAAVSGSADPSVSDSAEALEPPSDDASASDSAEVSEPVRDDASASDSAEVSEPVPDDADAAESTDSGHDDSGESAVRAVEGVGGEGTEGEENQAEEEQAEEQTPDEADGDADEKEE